MSRKITLFIVPGMKTNAEAFETVTNLPNIHLEEVICPASMSEWFDLPFVRDEDGVPYYGLEAINYFAHRIASQSQNTTPYIKDGRNGKPNKGNGFHKY